MGSGVTDGLVEEYAALMPCVSTLDGTIDRLAQVSALWAFLKARGWPGPHKYMVPWVCVSILYIYTYVFIHFQFRSVHRHCLVNDISYRDQACDDAAADPSSWPISLVQRIAKDLVHLLSSRRARSRNCPACFGLGSSLASGGGG